MDLKEIRDKETNHLRHELDEARRRLFDLRSQAVTEKLEDPSQLRKTKKDIARMLTVLRQRERAVAAGQPPQPAAPAQSEPQPQPQA